MTSIAMKHVIGVFAERRAELSKRGTQYDQGEREDRNAELDAMANALADRFAQAKPVYTLNGNRRFDRAWFLKMCGVSD